MINFKKLLEKKEVKTPEKVLELYPIDGYSFDPSTQKGMENALSRKAINSTYFWQKFGYFVLTIISLAASIWGGVKLGTTLFIFMALAVEVVKLILPSEAIIPRLLASVFSFLIASFAFYSTLVLDNANAGNKDKSEKMFIASIDNIDIQLKNLGDNIIETSSSISISNVKFDTNGYNKLIRKISIKSNELKKLKRQRHTYWQKVPNTRNKRSGKWMLDHPDKCTGTFCVKLQNKVSTLNALKATKKAMDSEKSKKMNIESMRIKTQQESVKMKREREATKQNLLKMRNKYQNQLMNMNADVKVPQSIGISMVLIVIFLLLIEYAQGAFKTSSEILIAHKRRVNMMYNNHKNKVDEKIEIIKEKKKEIKNNKSFFSRSNSEDKAVKNEKGQFKAGTKLMKSLALEIKKDLDEANSGVEKYTRIRVFKGFDKYGIGKTTNNFKKFKTLIDR